MKIFELVLRSPNSYSLSQKIHSRIKRRVNYWAGPLVLMFALFLTACGGGGGGGVPAVSLDAVSPLFSNGAKWNDYVVGSNWRVTTTDAAECNALTDSACLHGGERRLVIATGKTSCAGLTAADDLDAFNWACDASTGTARLVSTGLAADKGLSDLIDFGITPIPEFKLNKVTVFENGVAWAATPSTSWWPNNIDVGEIVAGPVLEISDESEIYVVLEDMNTAYALLADKVALVVKPGVRIGVTVPGNSVISNLNPVFGPEPRNHLWIEGNIDASGHSSGVSLNNVRFSMMRKLAVANANAFGVALSSSSHNTLAGVTATNNASFGVFLNNGSTNNTLAGVTATNNSASGVMLEQSNSNTLTGLTATNNGNYGVLLQQSNDNRLVAVSAANNQIDGVLFNFSDNNTLSSVTAANNSATGVTLAISNFNTISGLTSANHDFGGISLITAASNTVTGILKVGNNGAVGDCLSDGFEIDCDTIESVTLTPGITLADSFFGKVSRDDLENSSDDLLAGSALFPGNPSTFDWTRFENIYRGWGNGGLNSPTFDFDPTHRGRWTTGTGRIWDWSLLATDTVNLNVATLPLTGSNTLTHFWSNTTGTTFLPDAVEVAGDGVGNDNGLCESNETCLFMPNIGSYQGHGNIVSANFIDGSDVDSVKGVTLLQFESNGTENLGPPLPDTTPPAVSITSPVDFDFLFFDTETVSGTVTDNVDVASVTVNGIPATITGDTFSVSVPLTIGPNTLTAVATDSSSNSASHSIFVEFDDTLFGEPN